MKLEVVVSAKQANPVYTGFSRNGQGTRDDSLDNPDGKDWTKVKCKTDEPFSDDCKYDIEQGGRCTRDCHNGYCGHKEACSFPFQRSDE